MKYSCGLHFDMGIVDLVVGDVRVPVHWDILRQASQLVDDAFEIEPSAGQLMIDPDLDLDALDQFLCVVYRVGTVQCPTRDAVRKLINVAEFFNVTDGARRELDRLLATPSVLTLDPSDLNAWIDVVSLGESLSKRYPLFYTSALVAVARVLVELNTVAADVRVMGSRSFSKHVRSLALPSVSTLPGTSRMVIDRCVDLLQLSKKPASASVHIELEPYSLEATDLHVTSWQYHRRANELTVNLNRPVWYFTFLASDLVLGVTEDDGTTLEVDAHPNAIDMFLGVVRVAYTPTTPVKRVDITSARLTVRHHVTLE